MDAWAAAASGLLHIQYSLQPQPSLVQRAGAATAAIPIDILAIPCLTGNSSVLWLVSLLASDLPDCRGISGEYPQGGDLQILENRVRPGRWCFVWRRGDGDGHGPSRLCRHRLSSPAVSTIDLTGAWKEGFPKRGEQRHRG